MQLTHSKKYRERLADTPLNESEKINCRGDAVAYGRVCAKLSLPLSLERDVEEGFHEIAKEAYSRRMMQLHGAPF
jgi:hypothetical protein